MPRTRLSPLDQIMPRTYIRVFLIFNTNDTDTAIARLGEAVRQLGQKLRYLCGNVSETIDHMLEISWSTDDEDLTLKQIPAPSEFPPYAELERHGMPLSYFTKDLCPVGVFADHSKGAMPVSAFSTTPIRGGIILCICAHHNVFDGTGIGLLASMLAEQMRTGAVSGTVDVVEPLNRIVLLGSKEKTASYDLASALSKHREYHLPGVSLTAPSPPLSDGLPPTTTELLSFSVLKLRQVAEDHRLASGSAPSINIVLFSILWTVISRARLQRLRLQNKTQFASSKLGFAINGRGRIPALANLLYFGNINLFGLASVSSSTFTSETGLHEIIGHITAAVAIVDSQHVADVVELIDNLPDITKMWPGWTMSYGSDLTMTSWTGMPIFSSDFGEPLGKPDFVRIPIASSEVDGLITVLPRRYVGTDEAVEAVLMLRTDDLAKIKSDSLLQSVSIAQ